MSDVTREPEQVQRLAATRWSVAAGAFRSSSIGTEPQSPPGMGRDLGVSTDERTVTPGLWRIDWYPKGASVNAKCGTIGRFQETAILPKTGSNRRRVGERVLKRIGRAGLESLLRECAHLDCQQKGILHGDSWLALESLLLNLTGYRNRTLDTDANRLRIDYET